MEPHQPQKFAFPRRQFGKKNVVERAFQPSWFQKFTWLHYDENCDAAFCYLCSSAEKQGKLKAASKESAFLSKGFTNWKDATEGFRKHEKSRCHIDALQVMIVLPKTVPDVGEVLSSAHAKEKAHNRTMLVRILRNMKFFGRQGLPLRGA